MGVTGEINNEEIILGNSKIVKNYNIQNNHIEDEKRLQEAGNSIVYVIKNKEIIAIIGVNDIVRQNCKEVIDELSKKKIQTIMLTGDNKQTAEKIAKEIGKRK